MLRTSVFRLPVWLATLLFITATLPAMAVAPPTISSFSPEYVYVGQYGTNFPVTINGTNFSSVSAVNLGGRPASFVVNSTTMITAYVPASASTNFIYVTTSSGRAYSSLPFTVKPIPAPTISSFTPTSAYIGETGRVVTITGTNFMGVGSLVGYIKNTSVKIGGTRASISVVSDTTITATVPVNAIYPTYWISVTTNGGTAYSKDNFVIKPLPAPTISSFSPTSAYLGETNRTITITGMNFTGTGELIPMIRVLSVKIGGTSASFIVVSDNTITTVVPASVLYPIYWISVTTTGGTVYSKDNFTLKPIPAPTITSFTPSSGSVGDTVSITGTNFMGTGALSGLITVSSVKIGGTEASFNVGSDTSLMAVVPASVLYPIYWISVTTSGGAVYSGITFTVRAVSTPTISSFSPASGKTGDLVTITGTGFTGTTAVKFAGLTAVFTVVSATSITANVPSGAVTGPISVTAPGGTGGSAGSFTVIQAPTISSFTPTSGKLGDTAVITGTNFGGTPVVQFNGTTVTSYPAISDSSVTVVVPDGASTGKIAVTTLGGTVMSIDDFTVYQQPANIVFAPASGIVGDVVTLSGSGFTDVTAVAFNGTLAADFTVESDTSITVTVPSGATTGLVSVTNPSYTATSTERFTVYQQPVISSFLPDSGIVGDVVHIIGANFTDINEVEFNGAVVTPLAVDDTSITVTVPGGATTGMIGVSNPAYTASSTDRFTVYQQPTISSVQPDRGIVGERVTITGTNLADITGITFNNTAAVFYSVDNDTTITVTVPNGATTGKIVVSNPAYTAESANDFTVYQRPTITSFTPESGIVGDRVTITGTGFTGVSVISGVSFTGAMADIIAFTDTSIIVLVPNGATTGPITVTTPAGSTISARSFTVLQRPTISSFTPECGVVGDRVTISGTGFTGVLECLFMNMPGNITSSSDTSITVFVPNGATTGPITVTTPAGSTSSARNFTVYERPSISSFSPESGAAGQVVTITGNTFIGVTRVIFNITTAITYTVNSETSMTATVPSGATTGRISVNTLYGPATSAVDFVVNQSPAISSFTPSGGAVGIGVTINGSNFTGATAVYFGGVLQPTFTVLSDTTLTTTVPNGALTGPISVTTPCGTATSPLTFYVAPSISWFTPTVGQIGTVVTITGTNFIGVGQVTFNGVSAAISSVNPTTIVATVPSGATSGPISVTAQGGVATSSTSFTVQQNGVIIFWGKNGMGQGNLPAPNQNFTSLSSGWNHVAGLKQDGSVVCWGYNIYGECNVPSPNQNFAEVAAGYYHTAGLKRDGSVVCWGWTLYGQCTVPLPNENFTSVSTRNLHTVGLKRDGTVVCWGDNSYGQCVVPMPNQNFTAVSAGHSHTVGLKSDGSVVCWGFNNVGQCVVPAPNQGFIAVSAGASHSAGLKSDGSIVCWGYNGYDACNVPAPNMEFVAISAGMSHTVGLKRDGSVVCWGTNTNGECNVPGPNSGFIAISAGASYSSAIRNP
ncbi:MAG: IPT/TIG domain-containing protein [Armatimonadota bacterium]